MATARWCCLEDEKKSEDICAADLKYIESKILELLCQKDYSFEDATFSYLIPGEYSPFVQKLLELADIHNAIHLERLEALKPEAKQLLFAFYKGTRSDPLGHILSGFSDDYDATMHDILNPPPSTIDMSELTGITEGPDELWLQLPEDLQKEITPFTSVGNLLNRLNARLLRLNGRIVSDRDQSLGNTPKENIYYQL